LASSGTVLRFNFKDQNLDSSEPHFKVESKGTTQLGVTGVIDTLLGSEKEGLGVIVTLQKVAKVLSLYCTKLKKVVKKELQNENYVLF